MLLNRSRDTATSAMAVGVVHVLVPGGASEGRLAERAAHPVLAVLPGSGIDQPFTRDLGEPEDVIEFPKGKQARIRRDLRTMELELQPKIEIEPQHPGFAFTCRVSHDVTSIAISTH